MTPARRILVVEDDPYTRDLAGTALRGQGYEVVAAARMAQGLEAARALRPHLLLSDVVLPDGSGIDMARALREELPKKDMPVVILMSAFSKGRTADQRSMKEHAGAAAFVTKPLSIPHLLDVVAQHLNVSYVGESPRELSETLPRATHLPGAVSHPAGASGISAGQLPPPAPGAGGPPAPPGAEPALHAEPATVGEAAPPPALRNAAAPMTPAEPSAAGVSLNLLVALASAWRKGWTGTLLLTRSSGEKQVEKRIVIEQGQIVWATTSLTDEKLGRVLLRLGWLPREQYEPTLQEAARTGKQHGEVLVARGFLTAWQLEDALLQQIEQIVINALGWPEGTYRLAASTGRLETSRRIVTSPIPRLVLRAFREVIGTDRLDARLAALGDQPIARKPSVPAAAIAQLAPGPEEHRVLEALVTPGPLDRALAAHPEGPEAARPFVGALLALGIVAPATDGPPGGALASTGHPVHDPAGATPRPSTPAERPHPASMKPTRGLSPGRASEAPQTPKSRPTPAPDPAERQAAEEAARRLLTAEAASDAGRQAAERGDLAAAATALERAASLCPGEGEYRAWAAWVRALSARAAFDQALDAVTVELEAAAGLTPSSEGIFELIERVIRLRTAPGGGSGPSYL
jgi:CheY-like chemotaxis protein